MGEIKYRMVYYRQYYIHGLLTMPFLYTCNQSQTIYLLSGCASLSFRQIPVIALLVSFIRTKVR